MKIKLILPALTEAKSQYWRSIKYSLFPPLGLATLAAYAAADDEVEIVDEHVEPLSLDDRPDLIGIEIYITSAYRAYEIADHYRSQGVFVVLGGLHVTSLPDEALEHADAIVTGPAEEAWPRFLADFRSKQTRKRYASTVRSLENVPLPNRGLVKNRQYLVPNSITVSRGCPHSCSFCYKESFFGKDESFYHLPIHKALEEIDSLTGRHLFFLDDNIFGNRKFSRELFTNLVGRNRIWQGAATTISLTDTRMVELAAKSGCRSLFIGFETINKDNLGDYRKRHNLQAEYEEIVKALHAHGIMINASFVFGMDGDRRDVFKRTVAWALDQGIETSTFHILTPYPGTRLYRDYQAQGRITDWNWNNYDTRHLVFQHPAMTKREIEAGYWGAYDSFYSWRSIFRSAFEKESFKEVFRHVAYAGGWKKCERLWTALITLKKLAVAVPALESILERGSGRSGKIQPRPNRAPEHLVTGKPGSKLDPRF